MSNFDFLKGFDETLYKIGMRIEREVITSPSGVTADATKFLEHLLKKLLTISNLTYSSTKTFYSQIDAVYRAGTISYGYKNRIYSAYNLRSKIHSEFDETEKSDVIVAINLHEKLFYIAKKYYRDFNENYDGYKGLPTFKPIELDTSDDEIDMVKIPDFSQIVDVNYDCCVICGKPNRSSYLLCCPDCSRVLDNANNFISIRNEFGKDAQFTKDDLIEFGIPEGYVNQLISHLVREDMLKVKGRFITFNNMNFDSYLRKIDSYLAVGELITKFMEDKITPAEIKETREYKLGSIKQEPFYEFYKIIDHEIINKFEADILTTENIWMSIEYTTITQKQLKDWYLKNLGFFTRGTVNESFVLFNNLLMAEYVELKRQGLLEKDIKKRLNVSPEVYDLWITLEDTFEDEITQIKKELVLKALKEGKTKAEAIEMAGVTPREFDDFYNVSDFYQDEYAAEINREIEARKLRFISYLEVTSLKTACRYAKITVDEFYKWYDASRLNSEFYLESTRILMGKYLDERRKGTHKCDAIKIIGIKKKYLNHWLTRSLDICRQFKDDDLRVTVDLVLRGFKWNKSIEEIAEMADVKVTAIYRFIKTGEKGSKVYRELYEYYENEVIPVKLNEFLHHVENKPIRKALESSQLSDDELDKYYELGKSGDERYGEFYNEFLKIKRSKYLFNIGNGKSHNIAMKESGYTLQEYEDNKDDLAHSLFMIQQILVIEVIEDKKTTQIAAKKANVSVDEIYDWYFRGRDGEEDYVKFYEMLHMAYVRPAINAIQESLDNSKAHLDSLIKSNKNHFTKRDVEIWVEHGLLDNKVLTLNKPKEDDDEDDESKYNPNEMLREMGVEDYDKISVRKNSGQSSILSTREVDVEKLKREILKK